MGKALKTVGTVIGAAALIATGVGAVLMPGLAGTTTLLGVSVGTLNTVSAGMIAVGGMLDKPKSTGSGTPTEWPANVDQPTPFGFGRVGAAGKVIHRDEYGPDNRLFGVVSIYSGAGPIKGFVSFKADDALVTFASNGGTAVGKYNRQMWRSWRLGAQPDTALDRPTGLDGGASMPSWGASYKLSGKACDLWTLQQDSKFSVYPTGLPTPLCEFDGIYGYDPRYDSTYPGGSGTCRLNVRSTYRWIENPIIAGLNWALGMVENGHIVGGIGASINGIDVPAFVEAANIADANNWKVTAWPDTSEDVSEVLKQFLQAGGASYARHAGKISCVSRGAARPSIVTITARDTAGPLELDTGASDFNRLNTITPEFMSSAHGWKHVPTDPVTFEALRVEDGGKKSDQIRYRFVPNKTQVGQLAAYDILDAREPFSGTIPLKPHLRRLKRGDCFLIEEPGFLLDGVKCMVLSRTYNAQTGEVRVAFRSETDGKHDLALGKTTTMPSYPALTPTDPTLVTAPLPEDWRLVPKPPSEAGVQVPVVDVVGEVSNGSATAVHFEWTYDNEGAPLDDWKSAGIWPPTVTSIPVPADPGMWIWIGVSYLRGENFSDRQVYGPELVPGLTASDIIETGPRFNAVLESIAGAFGDPFALGDGLQALSSEVASARNGESNLATRLAEIVTQIADEETARISAQTQIKASLDIRPNLQPNGGFENGTAGIGWGGPTAVVDDVWGRSIRLIPAGAGTQSALLPLAPVEAGRRYVFSGDMAVFMSDADEEVVSRFVIGGYLDGVWVADITPAVQGQMTGSHDFDSSDARRQTYAVEFVVPSGINGVRAVPQVVSPASDIDYWAIRRCKIEAGALPASLYSSEASDRALAATVTSTQLATVALEDQLAGAGFRLVAEATGGAPAYYEAWSSAAGGYFVVAAPVVALVNTDPDGDPIVALEVSNGNAVLKGGLSVGTYITLGSGERWDIAYRSKTFARADGDTISFGVNLGSIPQYEFLRDNLLPLAAGEVYDLRLTSLTPTGATVYAKIVTPSTPTSQSAGPTTTLQSSGPRLQLTKSGPDSTTGDYNLSGSFSVSYREFPGSFGDPIAIGGTVEIWKYSGGVWSSAGVLPVSETVYNSNSGSSPVTSSASLSFAGVLQLGSGVDAFGATLKSMSGAARTPSDMVSLSASWTVAGSSSGTRSALPSGITTTIKITPQG